MSSSLISGYGLIWGSAVLIGLRILVQPQFYREVRWQSGNAFRCKRIGKLSRVQISLLLIGLIA